MYSFVPRLFWAKFFVMRYWAIADGDDGDQWDEFYSHGVVRITGRRNLGDLRLYRSQGELQQALKQADRKREYDVKRPNRKARLLFDFANETCSKNSSHASGPVSRTPLLR